MNKKVALILAIAIAFFSIVLVSSFGLLPEDLRVNVIMTDLYFNIEANEDGEKCIEMNFKENNNTINLYQYVKYGPADTTNVSLQFFSDQPSSKVAVSSTGMVTIYGHASLNSFTVTVASTDGSKLTDTVVIKKPSSNVADFGDDDWDWGVS